MLKDKLKQQKVEYFWETSLWFHIFKHQVLGACPLLCVVGTSADVLPHQKGITEC